MFTVKGLTGKITDLKVAIPAAQIIQPLTSARNTEDIDLRRMAQWAMNYLIRTPRKELNYEPVFQADHRKCPPIPEGHDVVVPCDTDARLNVEWYYMREVSGSEAGKDVEEGFHKRMLGYVREDGNVIAHPGAYNEGDINKIYKEEEFGVHIWGATLILQALAEDYRKTGHTISKITARKIINKLKSYVVYLEPGKCYLPAGQGMVKTDGTPIPNGWNRMPGNLVEPLVNCYLAFGDNDALDFAKAYAEGIMTGAQPDGIKIKENGDIDHGHSHITMHALWGIAHLGVVTGEKRYTEFVKRSWDFMLSRGTGAGWFPALPDGHPTDETCLTSDMISNAAMIARGGYPEYFDYVERYLRNRISPCQFVLTPEYKAEYSQIHKKAGEKIIDEALKELDKLQGGIFSYCGLNDLENSILGGTYHSLAGCCVPSGMRAIYTTWAHVIDSYPESKLGPAGIYVNMSFNRDSKWGKVVSFLPDEGRLTVNAAVKDTYFIRPPHWAPHNQVKAFVGTSEIPAEWSGDYITFIKAEPGTELTITYPLMQFRHEAGGSWKKFAPDVDLAYEWLGNTVISVEPPAVKTPIFQKMPRILPEPPEFI